MIRRQLLGDFQSCDGKSGKADTVKDKQRQFCDLWSEIGNVQLEDNKQDKGTAQSDHCIRGILEGGGRNIADDNITYSATAHCGDKAEDQNTEHIHFLPQLQRNR